MLELSHTSQRKVAHQQMSKALADRIVDATIMIQPYAAFAIMEGKAFPLRDI
jgi:hypothetical protein